YDRQITRQHHFFRWSYYKECRRCNRRTYRRIVRPGEDPISLSCKQHVPVSKIMNVRDNFCHDKTVERLLELPFIVEVPDLQIGSIAGFDRLVIFPQLDVGEIPQTKRHGTNLLVSMETAKVFFTVEL